MRAIAILVVLTGGAATVHAQDQSAFRSGFTIEAGLGPGLTLVRPDEGEGSNELGLSGLSIGMGAFVTRDVALLARISGTTLSQEVGTESEEFINASLHVGGQVWLTDRFVIGAAGGIGFFGPFADDSMAEDETGLALSARAAYSLFLSGNNSLRVGLEVMPCFYDSGEVTSTSLNGEWQWL